MPKKPLVMLPPMESGLDALLVCRTAKLSVMAVDTGAPVYMAVPEAVKPLRLW